MMVVAAAAEHYISASFEAASGGMQSYPKPQNSLQALQAQLHRDVQCLESPGLLPASSSKNKQGHIEGNNVSRSHLMREQFPQLLSASQLFWSPEKDVQGS
jgi:hypothetical protein